ncbi:MAG: FAD/NAD(P)-binding protein [Candidatus Altiarchaeota archaeon]
MENIYIPKICKILNVIEETPDIKTFRIDFKANHTPGQFVEVSVFNFGEAPISISSFSNEYIEITVRRVGRVTNAIHRLSEGDFLGIRGPYGNGYPMEKFYDKDLYIIGGGCGIAPLGSVLSYIEKFREKYKDISIFFGCRSPEDILFKRKIEIWKEKFNVYLTVDTANENWKCDVGVVTKILEKYKVESGNSVALICGPPIMMRFVIETLKKKNFGDEQIYLSLERYMKCGFGKCGHCMINDKYICKDGPVFRYDEAKFLED